MIGGSYTIRNYCPDDFDKYLRLQVESIQLDPCERFITVRDLRDNLARPNFEPQKDLFVAEFKETLVGYLSVTLEPEIQRALLDVLVHPLHRRKGIATELFSGGLQHVKESGIKSAQINVSETSTSAKDFLNQLGFKFIRYFLEMRLDLNGIRLPTTKTHVHKSRKLKTGEEKLLTEIQNRCFADTWGFNPNTEKEIAYRLHMHGRSPDDVILTYLDDLPVGYCWTIIDAEANSKRKRNRGLIHMLGVDPGYRHQEIGKAILLDGLQDLKAKGVDIVDLTVDSENPAACALYESVGFEVSAKMEWYEKEVK
jgi:mycothiol synthase